MLLSNTKELVQMTSKWYKKWKVLTWCVEIGALCLRQLETMYSAKFFQEILEMKLFLTLMNIFQALVKRWKIIKLNSANT